MFTDKQIELLNSIGKTPDMPIFQWAVICQYCDLSESFMREFSTNENFSRRVNWAIISKHQSLSEKFIREFESMLYWPWISECQRLSDNFIKEFKDKVNVDLQREVHPNLSDEERTSRAKDYAEKHNLEIDDEYLYAYREHCIRTNRGMFNLNRSGYRDGIYYTDWRCDHRENVENSFGFGIWPSAEQGNTKVRVKLTDFGVGDVDNKGKARVWGFEVV